MKIHRSPRIVRTTNDFFFLIGLKSAGSIAIKISVSLHRAIREIYNVLALQDFSAKERRFGWNNRLKRIGDSEREKPKRQHFAPDSPENRQTSSWLLRP